MKHFTLRGDFHLGELTAVFDSSVLHVERDWFVRLDEAIARWSFLALAIAFILRGAQQASLRAGYARVP
jgi:hypothetical protein